MLGGQTQITFATLPSSIQYIQTDKLRPLAVTSTTRLEALPDIPPMADFIPGYEVTSWTGIGAPKGTPTEIVEMLNREINVALAEPSVQARFVELGGKALPGTPGDFARFIADEVEKWGKVIKTAGIKGE